MQFISNNENNNNNIKEALIENNLKKIKKYLNEKNINYIIGNNMTALHYTLSLFYDNNDIIKYLLDNKADPFAKYGNLNCFDIAINNKKKYFIDYYYNNLKTELLNENALHKRKRDERESEISFIEEKYYELIESNNNFEEKIKNLEDKNNKLKLSNNIINKELEKHKNNNNNLVFKYNELKTSNNLLNEELEKYKKKYNELNKSFINLQENYKK